MNKSVIFLLLISALGCSLSYAKESQQSLDQIVAVVNEDVITKSEYNQTVSRMRLQIAQMHSPVPSDAELRKQAMDQAVNRRLQLQIAKQSNVDVSNEEVDKAIGRIAQQNNMTVDAMYARIAQDGIPKKEYRDEFREQMVLQKLQQHEIGGKLNLTQQEVTNFIRSKAWQTNGLKEYHLEDILVSLSDTPSSQEVITAKKHAEQLLAKLNQGQDFQQVAQTESGSQGGDLGWRKLPEIPSAFAEQVARMKIAQVAGPIQTSNGFHIIRLAEVRELEANKVPNRKQVEGLLLQRKFEEAVQTWVSKLRSQAFVVIHPEKVNA